MSKPEPAPTKRGFDVSSRLLDAIMYPELKDLVQQRRAFGMRKYGQSLYSEDGRNGLEDARQELGDLLQYVFKVFGPGATEKHSVEELRQFADLWAEAKVFIDKLVLK